LKRWLDIHGTGSSEVTGALRGIVRTIIYCDGDTIFGLGDLPFVCVAFVACNSQFDENLLIGLARRMVFSCQGLFYGVSCIDEDTIRIINGHLFSTRSIQ
jgi:hypothetical protein